MKWHRPYFIIYAGSKASTEILQPASFASTRWINCIEGLEKTIIDCVSKAGADVAKNVKAISVDTTGSRPVAMHWQPWDTALSALTELTIGQKHKVCMFR